jgi:hypothetical protein
LRPGDHRTWFVMAGESHEYRVEVAGTLLRVWQSGAPTTVGQLRAFQGELERVLADTSARRALFDNRETTSPTDDIRDAMLAWVCEAGRFEAVAVVLQSDMLAVRLNMDAIAHRVRMRAFDSVPAAQKWLMELA